MQGEHLNAEKYLSAGEKAEEYVHVGEYLRTGQREKPCDYEHGLRLILCLTAPAVTHHGVHPTGLWGLLYKSPPGQNYFRKKYMVSNSFLFACRKKKKNSQDMEF